MNVIESFLTKNPYYTAGRTITPVAFMLHSVGCPQPDANVFVRIWNDESYTRACVHAFIDANTGDIYQTLPWNYRAGHAGGSANNTHIGVEMCEPACIKYTSGANFTCSDLETARAAVTRTYLAAVELFAMLCKEYDRDPLSPGVIVSHREGSKLGIASGHADPEHLWKGLGMSYTMDTFRKAVNDKMNESKVMYRVQVGAFGKKENAEECLAKLKAAGFSGYITSTGEKTETQKKPVSPVAPEYTLTQFIKDVQAAIGAAVDGSAGSETIGKTVTLSAKKNASHAAVKPVQKRLAALGYREVGEADGHAGVKFTSAVAHFQQDNGCTVDGEITARGNTWRKLFTVK